MAYSYTCELCNRSFTYKNANSMASGKHKHLKSKNHLLNEQVNKEQSKNLAFNLKLNRLIKKIELIEDYLFKKGKRINFLEKEIKQIKEHLYM